jgi:predicted amidophosphoribosyltransferase
MILMLKYGRHEALAFRLGKALGGVIAPPDLDVLVPVPLHLKSERRYNQAGAIARGLGGAWGIEAWDAARWAMDVAARAGMGRRERLALSTDAFVFDEDLSGLRVGLVDDVSTTGATLFRLAGAARSRGADIAGAFVIALARGAGAPPAGGKKNGENS